AFRLAFSIPAGFADVVKAPNVIDPTQPGQSIRIRPRETAQLLVKNPNGDVSLRCVNLLLPGGYCREKICWLWLPDAGSSDRLAPEPTGFAKSDQDQGNGGERFFLRRKADVSFNIDAF